MIPIECPKCGRGGSVPPDRLNARLVCKACHTVFHLDNTGRMVMGEPESFDMKTTKSRADEVGGIADFDLAQTWNDIPMPIKYGVPGVLVVVFGWLYLLPMISGASSPDYIGRAESVIRSLTSNDRSKAVSLSTLDSAEAAGRWFDMVHSEIERLQITSDVPVNPALFSANPEKDDEITILVVLAKSGSTEPPVTVTLPMKRQGSSWLFEATRGLESAEKAAAASAANAKKNKR
jgi:hypothetical protein